MYRGTHQRNWIRCYDLDSNGYNEYEVLHEESATNGYGVFSIIEHHYRSRTPFFVIWRKNRNTTRDTTVMRDPLGGERMWDREEMGYSSLCDAIDSIPAWNSCFSFPEKPKRYRVRDSQKSRVYRWEHKMSKDIGPTEMEVARWPNGTVDYVEHDKLKRRRSHQFLQDALEHICFNLDEKIPTLKFRSGGRCSYGGYDIRLLPSHCNLLILLHELSHVLHRRWSNNHDNEQGHGKEFVGIYSYMLIRFGEVERDAIVRHAVEHRVKMELPDRYWVWADMTNTTRANLTKEAA